MSGAAPDGRGLASVSLDLDGLVHYARLHGLQADVVPGEAVDLLAERAVPRFLDLLGEVGARGTLFVIGGEVTALRDRCFAALGEGHELRPQPRPTTRSPDVQPRPSTPTSPPPRRC